MRLFSLLALSTLLSAPAFAADLGTYRPGSPYHSVVAPGADVCDSQCSGDAQCKGWNYVKVNPRAPGVCEFNSKSVSPIESAISISGPGGMSAAPNLMQGNTNTVRVGTSTRSVPRSNAVTIGQTPSGRRIVREAAPQRIQPEQAVSRRPVQGGSLTAQQNQYRAATGHAAPQARAPQTRQAAPQGYPQSRQQPRAQQQRPQQLAARPNMRAPQMRQQPAASQGQRLMRDPRIQAPQQAPQQQGPRFQHNLDGVSHRPHNMMARPNAQMPQQQMNNAPKGRPPIGVPIQGQQQQAQRRTAPVPQQRAIPRGSVNDPVTHANGAERVQAAAQRQAAMTYQQAQQSLFGSLNDDVQAPRPMAAPPADPNAPIPTSQARPTQPVSQGSLGALAGAPRG